MSEHTNLERIRREQVNRVRRRLSQIRPEDSDMIALVGAVKGILDIIADDGDDE
jgi:uncharacterized membrane protein